MVTLAVWFTGFFTASQLGMTGKRKNDEGSRKQKKNLLYKGMQDREAAGFERAFSAQASRKIAEIHASIPAIFHFT